MQIHEKSRIIDRDNEWYIDATLTDGRHVKGIALLDMGGSDFYDFDNNSIDIDDDHDDWYEIEQAEETIEPWLRLN